MTDLEESRQLWLRLARDAGLAAAEARRAEARARAAERESVAAQERAESAARFFAQRMADLRKAPEDDS